MKNLLILFLILSVASSCNSNDNNNIESVEITYLKGSFEASNPLVCGSISSFHLNKDTILQDKQILSNIENQIRLLKESKKDSSNADCDVRLQCKLTFKKDKRKTLLCIGTFNCIMMEDKTMGINNSLAYLLKRYSGYYNYFPIEDLNLFDEIKQFGIPSDYKDLRRKQSSNVIPLPLE